jgi:hypothetical protein
VVLDEQGWRQGKSASLTSATHADRYRIGKVWYSVSSQWLENQQLDEVRHFGRHTMAVGEYD